LVVNRIRTRICITSIIVSIMIKMYVYLNIYFRSK